MVQGLETLPLGRALLLSPACCWVTASRFSLPLSPLLVTVCTDNHTLLKGPQRGAQVVFFNEKESESKPPKFNICLTPQIILNPCFFPPKSNSVWWLNLVWCIEQKLKHKCASNWALQIVFHFFYQQILSSSLWVATKMANKTPNI